MCDIMGVTTGRIGCRETRGERHDERQEMCHLRLMPHYIAEAEDEDHYEKTLEIMETRPDISKAEFIEVMKLTGEYEGEFSIADDD